MSQDKLYQGNGTSLLSWNQLKNLLKALNSFELKINEEDENEIILSPRQQDFLPDLETIVNESSNLMNLQTFATINKEKNAILLRLMK